MSKKLLSCILLFSISFACFSQPKVHFNFLSHNEETTQWLATPYYTANRLKLITLSNYFQTSGITWNMQSDWRYLSSVLSKETSALMASTNNKNILRWMHEDKGVEMDPHAHESQYLYPDVVHLMDSIGLPESKVMGGTIYNDSNGVNVWTNLINGQYGAVFPNSFWRPDYMMGGGTPNHVADLKYFGFWNPQDTAHYLVHDTTNHLRHIGVGCEIKIKSPVVVSDILAEVHDVINMVQSGQYPSKGFYAQTIFFEKGDLNDTTFYSAVVEIADSVNTIVSSGAAQWSTLKQSYTEWETAYNAQMFQWECGQVVNEIEENKDDNFKVFPNPAAGKIIFELKSADHTSVKLFNSMGEQVYQSEINSRQHEIADHSLKPGIYLYQMQSSSGVAKSGKLIIQ